MTRPLGAFISNWNSNSHRQLTDYGFVKWYTEVEYYKGQKVNIMKYKTRHHSNDNYLRGDTKSSGFYDMNTIHHLDFYLNDKKILLNTNVYTTRIEN